MVDDPLSHLDPNAPPGVKIQILQAEDMKAGEVGKPPPFLTSPCHGIRMLTAQWDATQNIVVLSCAECLTPIVGVKVEKRSRIVKP